MAMSANNRNDQYSHYPRISALIGMAFMLLTVATLVPYLAQHQPVGLWSHLLYLMGIVFFFSLMTSGATLFWMGIRKLGRR